MSNVYIVNTPIWLDVDRIFKSDTPIPTYNYDIQVHTDEEDLDVVSMVSLDCLRDYVNKVGDYVQIQFQMQMGMYINRFYPKRHNLEVTVKRTMLNATGTGSDPDAETEIERYKAVFMTDKNEHVNLRVSDSVDEFTLDNQAPMDVTLQLLNRTLEPLRIKTLFGVFKNVQREELIRGILGGESAKILIDGKPGIDALDIVKPHNTMPVKHVIFPNNTPVLAVPTFLQERHTGVYTSGIGNYFQTYKDKRTWFIYPIFDITRFDDRVGKVIVYSIPSQQFLGVERTFMIDDKTIHIVATGQKMYQDDGEASQMESGVGFRQADADFFMDKPVKITKHGPVGIRRKMNTEVVMKKRDDNLDYAPVASKGIGANRFAEYSRTVINNAARVDLTWNNANNSLIYPGMPCKYVYMDGDKVKEVRGIIVATQSISTKGNSTSGVKKTDTRYTMTTMLTLYVEKFTNVDDMGASDKLVAKYFK